MAGVERMTRDEGMIPNVLAERYASSAMCRIWSREEKVRRERLLWIEVMKAQSRHGFNISKDQIARYEENVGNIDLSAIDERERMLKHDVKARIEEFNHLAGLELIHLGLTSRDLTENVELIQIRDALKVIEAEVLGVLRLLSKRIEEYKELVIVGRSHNIPAQLTTLGKRFASIAEELLFAFERLDSLMKRLPLRGLRGPMGTSQDLRDLVGVEATQVESEVTKSLGFDRVLDSTGQVYPRSIDFEVISTLIQLSAAPSNLAILVRLMSGAGLLSEGLSEGQVGSSAMPHKINPRSSERINGLSVVLKGYLSMASEVAGDQWNEGDVSCSVVRRVCLPDAFFTADGIFQTVATILAEITVVEEAIEKEVDSHLSLLATSALLMEVVKKGMGREEAHSVIQRESIAYLKSWQSGEGSSFAEALARDPLFPLSQGEIENIIRSVRLGPSVVDEHITRVQARIFKVLESTDSILVPWREIL